MKAHTINITPFQDQKAGTSGLRRCVKDFARAHYLPSFVQAVFNTLGGVRGKRIVIGGDGRYFSEQAREIIVNMAITQGAKEIYLGLDGLISTPAASYLIQHYQADFALLLTASHNPGGENGDFGIKINLSQGEPAPEKVTEAVFQQACVLKSYEISEGFSMPSLAKAASFHIEGCAVHVLDSYQEYTRLMETLFDFSLIADYLRRHPMYFDAMHGVTGGYARHLFHQTLGLSQDYLLHTQPLADFAGRSPDPNPHNIATLQAAMDKAEDRVCMGAASDGDGDRYLILGRNGFVSPCDSLALIAANTAAIPCLKGKLTGVARSFPTSRALDIVAAHLKIPCYETPTGWKFFAGLLDNDLIQLCGEESFGTSGRHIREKDGLWAILCWLNILAVSGDTVDSLLQKHWQTFGRHFYSRFDYTDLQPEQAHAMLDHFSAKLDKWIGHSENGLTITNAGNFSYRDPLSEELTPNQGIQIIFGNTARIMCRLSGTGTTGATLRLYAEYWQQDINKKPLFPNPTALLAIMAEGMLNIKHFCGRHQADTIT